jgi:hypothetical protein
MAFAAEASGVDGLGRVSVGGGFRWVPNGWFQSRAARAGTPVIPGIEGGPQASASFGLGVSSALEVSVDLVLAYQNINLRSAEGTTVSLDSLTAGGLLGGRLTATDVFFKGFMPFASVQAGPLLASITSASMTVPERVVLAVSASVGATWRFDDRYGITLEGRYLWARSVIPEISGINVGGVMASVMFTFFFPPSLKRDLEVPGF